MNSKYNYVVFIGRFQPFHYAHFNIVKQALDIGQKVIVLIGSSFQPRTPKNPWTHQEREKMIRSSFSDEENLNLIFSPLADHLYNNGKWIEDVQASVLNIVSLAFDDPKEASVALIGHHKDDGSWFLDAFPQWKQIEVPEHKLLNATDIREIYLHPDDYLNQVDFDKMPKPTIDFIEQFEQSQDFKYLVNEYNFLLEHNKKWGGSPYTPTFNCVDAVVIQSGHVLLIKRKASPGQNTVAIPGGYINSAESIIDGMIRELREETKIKVPEKILRSCIVDNKVFDHPKRSLRGRIFSHAYCIRLNLEGKLPKIKGSDDAKDAFWVPFADLNNLREKFFEDHWDIVQYFLSRI